VSSTQQDFVEDTEKSAVYAFCPAEKKFAS
jgi:hypothetical protein